MFTSPIHFNPKGPSTESDFAKDCASLPPAMPIDGIEETPQLNQFAIDHCSDAALWMEPDGRIFYVNDEACRILGYDRRELLQKRVHDLDPNLPAEAWTEHWRQIKQNQRLRLESVHLTKHGQRIPVDINAYFACIDGREFACAFARDLTEQKQVERKTREYEIRLDMSQRMEALGTLAGGIAHDFNNILSAILGYAELSLDGLPREAPQQDYLREIITAGTRARDLVHQILTFSRQAERTVQPMQFKSIAKEALKLLRASIPSTVDIRANMASDGLVMADAGQLHQIVMNLCANAAQAMPAEGGVMNVSLETVTLDAAYAASHPGIEPGHYLRWMVSGRGKAIDPSGTDRLAESLFTTQAAAKGSGSGLSIVRGIVSEYGGHMHEERQSGNGTTVSVFLPLVERARRPVAEPAENLPTGTGREHILLVDDEPVVARMVAMMLERLRYQVTSRTSSIEALALFKEKGAQFDLVITDLTMPNLPGQKLAAELNKIRPGIPIILCTGYSGEISEQKAAKTGIQATVMKPIDKAELAATVRNVLDKAKAAI